MSQRRVQAEIDRTLKKITEGIESFHIIWEKFNSATNVCHISLSLCDLTSSTNPRHPFRLPCPIQYNQKEKYESDLKKDIKKLQRYRDSLKVWAASSEIKEKGAILQARRLIEVEMEKFKVVEKEFKTKAYSREGLSNSDRLDPQTKKKEEALSFLQTSLERLHDEMERFEFEAESIRNRKKKLAAADAEQIALLEERVKSHQFHCGKLELVMRYLTNDSVSIQDVLDLKDSVEYYLEESGSAEFVHDSDMYEGVLSSQELAEESASSVGSYSEGDDGGEQREEPQDVAGEESSHSHSHSNKNGGSSSVDGPSEPTEPQRVEGHNPTADAAHPNKNMNMNMNSGTNAPRIAPTPPGAGLSKEQLQSHMSVGLRLLPTSTARLRTSATVVVPPLARLGYANNGGALLHWCGENFLRDCVTLLDSTTLLYIFYYEQGSHRQARAAQELHNRQWRWHIASGRWINGRDNVGWTVDGPEWGAVKLGQYPSDGYWVPR
jgi:CCR4-NOT transcription complex subunit 3